jgi:hypothetical protein
MSLLLILLATYAAIAGVTALAASWVLRRFGKQPDFVRVFMSFSSDRSGSGPHYWGFTARPGGLSCQYSRSPLRWPSSIGSRRSGLGRRASDSFSTSAPTRFTTCLKWRDEFHFCSLRPASVISVTLRSSVVRLLKPTFYFRRWATPELSGTAARVRIFAVALVCRSLVWFEVSLTNSQTARVGFRLIQTGDSVAARSTLACLPLLFAPITRAAWAILTELALVVPVRMNCGKRSKHSPVPGLRNHQLNVPGRVKPLMIAWLLFPAKRFE